WQIALQWRTDGEVLWQQPDLFADPWGGEPDPAAGDGAETLARAVTRLLGLPDSQVLAAHEDLLAQRLDALRRPDGPAPDESDLDDLASADSVSPIAGWVLPIVTGEQWRSPVWRFRRGRLVLLPGTSPVGLRL